VRGGAQEVFCEPTREGAYAQRAGSFQALLRWRALMRMWLMVSAMCLLLGCQNSRNSCGDLECQTWEGETTENCRGDCIPLGCADGTCDPFGRESCMWCPQDCDCRPECGDGVCSSTESCAACPSDCRTSCASTCGPANCAGCCAGNTCLTGSLLNSCGSGGGVCQACGTDMVCNDMRCTVDPASRWNFYVHSVAIEPPYNGVPYDDDGPPDLVLEVVNPITGERVGRKHPRRGTLSRPRQPPHLSHERPGLRFVRGALPRLDGRRRLV
jgi:hypothetical protein